MAYPHDDVASVHLFVVGDDLIVSAHDAADRRGRSPVAGLALILFLAEFDLSIRTGEVKLTCGTEII
jgi:hypothetical protein